MIFHRPIYAPNVILVDLPESKLQQAIPKIMKHLSIREQVIGVNALSDDYNLSSRKIIIHNEDYEVYREYPSQFNNPSRYLLDSGAKVAYFIDASSDSFKAAFVHVYDLINDDYPIVCISNELTNHINSAITIIDTEKPTRNSDKITAQFMNLDDFLNSDVRYDVNKFIVEQ